MVGSEGLPPWQARRRPALTGLSWRLSPLVLFLLLFLALLPPPNNRTAARTGAVPPFGRLSDLSPQQQTAAACGPAMARRQPGTPVRSDILSCPTLLV